MHRAERIAFLTLVLTVSASCARPPQPIPRDLKVGVHRVRLIPPAGWETVEHGREHLFRKEEMQVTLADLGPATVEGMVRELESARTVWLAGRRKDALAKVRALHGPPLSFAPAGGRATYWRHWNDRLYDGTWADSAAIGLSFDDLIEATEDLNEASSDNKASYVLATFAQPWRKEIADRDQRLVQGSVWTEVHTWNRVSHMDEGRVAFLENGGRFLVLAIDRGPIEVTGPVFEELLATIEVLADSASAR